MDQNELVNKARAIGLGDHIIYLPQKSLIREIQKSQGKESCYMSDYRYACQGACEWCIQCKTMTAEWLR